MKMNFTKAFATLSALGMALVLLRGIKFDIRHRNSGMISVVAGRSGAAGPAIDLKEYLPFGAGPEAGRAKSGFRIEGEIPVLDGASALYPVFSAVATAAYPEESVRFDGENFTAESKVQMRNTRGAYKAVVDGAADIIFCAAPSREQLSYARERGVELEFVPIGLEAFVFIANAENPVGGLSSEQVKGIYSGRIRRWSEVGGPDDLIAAWQRKEGSGSQTAFLNFMGGEEARPNPLGLLLGSPIGYSFRFYVEGIKKEAGVKMLPLDGIAPTKENIRNGKYPLSSSFFAVYRKDDRNGNVRRLVEWLLSPEGQGIIEDNGYVPLEG